jgi:cyclic beta-1,2-glucan synthetase
MSANASPASLDAYLSDLTKDHSSVTTVRIRGLTGARLKRRLQARLDRLTERAGTLPETIHWQLVGLNWLDENQHIIREAIVQVGGSLPTGFLRKLPTFRTASGTDELRVNSLAEAVVEYCALPLDIASIEQFLSAYQADVPLTLGELWALPTLLRVVVIGVLCDALDEGLELASRGARKERETEIAGTLSGAILSLRTIAATGWRQFVEQQSVVERILKEDASGDYPRMDPDSRNRYRERVERLARSLKVPEPTLAETAVKLGTAATGAATQRERHVGHYLIGQGLPLLEKSVRGRPLLREKIGLRTHSTKSWGYLFAVGVPTLSSLIVLSRLFATLYNGALGGWILLVLVIVPVVTIWTEIVNWLTTQFLVPRALPKLDYSEGIPVEHTTIVAVPCMLSTHEEIDHLIDNLEISYLGNDDPRLRFALLSDYVDADHAEDEIDRELLDYTRAGIDALNVRYGHNHERTFAIIHRRRLWNERAVRWMGWERKRGKIDELNRWLLGADDTSISVIYSDHSTLRSARYVITLDADNQLLPGTAAELIGALAHPLNQPRFDDTGRRLLGGYTVIQPRVDLHPASTNRTLFSRLMSGDTGIDLYHSAVSETYQDLFGQGIYAGKGIYDVRAFAHSVEGRVPTNAVLSHDLLEGVLGRAAFASDIVVLENASPNLMAELKRQHRWIRGDWQLLPWLLPIRGGKQYRDVDLLGRWKLFDNLRRSLLPPSLLALYFGGWILIPEYGTIWTLAVALTPALGILYTLLSEVRHSALRWGTLRSTVLRLTSNLGKHVAQWLINLAVLPIVALTMLDAVARTLARVTVTRRNLLEWTPAAQTERTAVGAGLSASYRRAIVAPMAGLAAVSVAVLNEPANVLAAALGAAWFAAPLLTWFMGRERGEPEQLDQAGTTELRLLARRTWQFYERFVGPETHWLPPDNYQEAPKLSVAERTSPTNIGLFLLASVAAYDLGYIGASGLLTRIDGTTATLLRMRQFRGHLFNWYSTRDLSVLAPDYVSTVDSGNLLAALLVCRTALENIGTTPLAHLRARGSLTDIVANIADIIGSTGSRDAQLATESVTGVLSTLRERLAQTPDHVDAWADTMAEIRDELCAQLDAAVLGLAEQRKANWDASEIEILRTWVIQLRYEAESLRGEIANLLACWPDVEARKHSVGQELPALRTLGEVIELVDIAAAGRKDADEIERTAKDLREMLALRDRTVRRIDAIVATTDFSFLFDATRKLFHIGYNNTTGELDASYYDLLASEARIASLIAIAKGDVPISHWVHLGRPLRRLGGMRVALSWSATAFEYLMPRLFMESPPHGLMDSSCRAVIREQRKLARRSAAPWGVSESAYFDLDAAGHYKYYAFGVDSLALRRSTRKRYVVSPYASILALPFEPAKVIDNLRRFRDFGCWGRYGLYEALDFGENHNAKSKPRVVQTFMAHHQAMILAPIANLLHNDSLVRRFHANPAIRAVEHLLYEALPKRAQDRIVRHMPPARPRVVPVMTAEHVNIATNRTKRFVNVVSNGHLTARTSGRGSGDITWNERAVTRWQPRTMGPDGGDRIYLSESDIDDIYTLGVSDVKSGPTAEVWCAPYQTEIHQRFGTLFARLTVGVAPDNDVAFKRVTLTNESTWRRSITLTHYAEIVLASAAEDQRHPAFNKLFIESEYVTEPSALLFSRRPRSSDEAGLCCAVGVVAAPEFKPTIQVETDRRAFLGRANGYRRPAALCSADAVAGAKGDAGLDPVAAFSVTLDMPPGTTSQVVFLTAVSSEKSQALELVAHFRSFERVAFGLEQARRRAAAELTDLAIDSEEVARLLEIYADMLWPRPLTAQALARLDLRESILGALWARGISGDFPICMACSRRRSDSDEAEKLLVLQAYLSGRRVPIDVVLVDESTSSYAEPVRNALEELIEKYRRPHERNHTFILSANNLSATERTSIDAAALVRFRSDGDNTDGLRDRRFAPHRDLPDFIPTRSLVDHEVTEIGSIESPDLEFDNSYGGIDARNDDYVIRVSSATPTPAPWINVLANSKFGSIVSERGAATTWYGNSSEHRLTPWYNDPVGDRSGEAIYVRDEETGEFWSAMPWPVPGGRDYLVRHGAGFSSFEHVSHQFRQHAECLVDKEHPAKCIFVRLHNTAGRPRRITLTYYLEWVLGNHYEDNGPFIVPAISHRHNTLLARNALPRSGGERVAFVTSTEPLHGYTTDRREFLGTARDPARPAALRRLGLSGEIVTAAEPCCAFQIHLDLAADEATEICFTVGAGDNRQSALNLASQFGAREFVEARRDETKRYWKDLLSRCRIRTPNRALDVLFNRWLQYQNLACRLWGRSGLYQAAGGFGFRDQLQDSLALLHVRPDLTREQIIRACSVQFPEGDALHWWHDTPTRGVRTRCSDDLLWLPYAVSEYIRTANDATILDEEIAFLGGEALRADEDDRYAEYSPSQIVATVYEHCNRAIDARASTGEHGLPLIGTGDWNDGLNRVGIAGRGESAWLGWFLADVCDCFAELAETRNESARSAALAKRRDALVESLERHAWNGDWYLRAYYDDGSTLGAAGDTECQIDLNAQTWPVITGFAHPDRANRAFDSAAERLVDADARLIKLLAPPFSRTLKDPGYIKGYPPGVRENGGQYTHASTWAVWAAAKLKRPDQAMLLTDLLNPLLRATNKASADRYRGEPYVLAGDVYSVEPRVGQAGWTWYTGSAAWTYRIVLEQILGIQPVHGKLTIRPCVPRSWPTFEVDYSVGDTVYSIEIRNPAGIAESGVAFELDDKRVEAVELIDDGRDHRVIASATNGQSANLET